MTKRINKWDNIKAVLMYLVVFGHFLDYFTSDSGLCRSAFLFIYFFHMPLFIFISGLFGKNTVDKGKNTKLIGFAFLYVAFKLLITFFNYLSSGKFTFSLLKESNIPWYLLTLIVYPLVIRKLKNFKPLWILGTSVVLALIIGYDKTFGDYFAISRLIVYFPFYYCGYILNQEDILKVTNSRAVKISGFFFIAALFTASFLMCDTLYSIRAMLTARNSYHALGSYGIIGPVFRLGVYALSVLSSVAVISLTPENTPFNILAFFGKRTLPVYVFHIFIIKLLLNQFGLKKVLLSVDPLLSICIMAVLSAVIMVVCCLKPFHAAVKFICTLPDKMLKNDVK